MIQERGHWKKCYNIWKLSHRARQRISEKQYRIYSGRHAFYR
jgi:hypothetical protein